MFYYLLDYAKHKDTHIISGLACSICQCEVSTPQAYGEHMEIHHPSLVFSSPEETTPVPPVSTAPVSDPVPVLPPVSVPVPPAEEMHSSGSNDSNQSK